MVRGAPGKAKGEGIAKERKPGISWTQSSRFRSHMSRGKVGNYQGSMRKNGHVTEKTKAEGKKKGPGGGINSGKKSPLNNPSIEMEDRWEKARPRSP